MDLGFSELLFLFGLGLLLFGPRKIPEIGRQLGRAMAEFKKASNEFQSQLNEEVRNLDLETESNTIANPAMPPMGTSARKLSSQGVIEDAEAASSQPGRTLPTNG